MGRIWRRRWLWPGLFCVGLVGAVLQRGANAQTGSQTATQTATQAPAKTTTTAASKFVPLPDVAQPVRLRVALADNPRIAPLTPSVASEVLEQTRKIVKTHFDLDIEFVPPVRLPLADLFEAIPSATRQIAEKRRLDATHQAGAVWRLTASLLKDMREAGHLAEQRQFALPHLLAPPRNGTDFALAGAIVETQHALLKSWADSKGRDGLPLLGADRFNEYTYWWALGDSPMPYDLILTNQLIASAEWQDNSVHSALRGGVSNGITTQSRHSTYQLYSVVSSFPFFDNSATTLKLRAGIVAEPAQAVTQMAVMVAHELGHLLLHLGHPFGNAACVMTPPQRLEFQAWVAGLNATKCQLGSNKANTPGAVPFTAADLLFKNAAAVK